MRTASLVLLTVLLAGCPRRGDTRVAGSDDAQLAAYEATLEELRARRTTGGVSCTGRCDLATRTCGVAEELCAVVERNPERGDLPRRCVEAREKCAEATDDCTRCRARR
ncbi:MAG TPA: hypothetical protein VLQ93_19955 [Myxococcaceae bacterium]|nr:hypothetical protein [Myxococcaceae bacterium]